MIGYKDSYEFEPDDLKELFLSVNWQAGNHPEKLVIAMKNSSSVFSAWKNDKLIGLVNVLDDGIMTAYVHFLLVKPEFQGQGIGKELLRMITEKYKDYMRIVLVADEKESIFYQSAGFNIMKGAAAMFVNRF